MPRKFWRDVAKKLEEYVFTRPLSYGEHSRHNNIQIPGFRWITNNTDTTLPMTIQRHHVLDT